MSSERQTYTKIRDRILVDIDTAFAAASVEGGNYERGLVEYAIACALAAVCFLLYSAIEIAEYNTIPDRADSAAMPRWSAFFGLTAKSPTPNKGTARWVAAPGAVLPAGTVVRLRDGTEYTVDADTAESGAFVTPALTAVVPGSAGRATAGASIALGSPVPGISAQGVVLAPGLADGADRETLRSLLARLLARIRNPPRGGGVGDYKAWALEVPGVTRAWEYTPHDRPSIRPGSVRVLFATDGEATPIPSGPKVAEVQAYIDARRPVTVPDFLAAAPTPLPVAFTVGLVLEPGATLSAVRLAVTDALKALLREEAEPGKTIPLSRLREAISAAAGEYSHTLVTPSADVDPEDNELPVFDGISWS